MHVDTYAALCDLVVLEQFKNSVRSHIAVNISEHKVKTAAQAAALADEYMLTHRDERDLRVRDEGSVFNSTGKWQERSIRALNQLPCVLSLQLHNHLST